MLDITARSRSSLQASFSDRRLDSLNFQCLFLILCYYTDMKKSSIVLIGLALGVATLTASEYRIKTIKVLPINSYPARIELNGITIAADPYTTDEKSFSAFDIKHLNSHGYFPIHIIIKNATSSFLTLTTRNIVLIRGSGQKLYTTSATLVVDDVVRAGLAVKSPKKLTKDTGSPLTDFTNKELANRTIDPQATTDGFLFFFSPDPQKNPFVGSTLYIPRIEEEGTRKSVGPFSIALDPSASAPK
jgi:hypothetical protein